MWMLLKLACIFIWYEQEERLVYSKCESLAVAYTYLYSYIRECNSLNMPTGKNLL